MVAQSQTRLAKLQAVNALLARANRAAFDNVRTRGLMAAGDKPAVTQSTTEPNIATYNRLPSSGASTPSNYDSFATVNGGWRIGTSNQVYCYSITKTLGQATGQGAAFAYQITTRIQMLLDGDWIAFGLSNTAATKWRLIVDGRYYDMAGFTPSGAGLVYWTLDFSGAANPTKLKKIEIELQRGSGDEPTGFGRIYTKKTDTVRAPSPADRGPRVIVQSDSFGAGANASFVGDGFVRQFADYAGIDDVWSNGGSGGGFIRGMNSDGGPNGLERIADITAWTPAAVVFAHGFNDMANEGNVLRIGTASLALLTTQMLACIVAVRTALPNVPIIILSPWRSGATTIRNRFATYDAGMAAAVAALSDPMTVYQSLSGVFSGTGNTGAAASDGNADRYVSPAPDNTHPNDAGHEYLGKIVAQAYTSALQAIATSLAA